MSAATTYAILLVLRDVRDRVPALLDRLAALPAVAGMMPAAIIVVDDGSTDGTRQAVDAWCDAVEGADGRRWVRLSLDRPGGHAQCLQLALVKTTADVAVLLHADADLSVADLEGLLRPFHERRADAVLGVRADRVAAMPVLARWRRRLCRGITGLDLADPETPVRAVSTALWRTIPMTGREAMFELEMTIKLGKRGARLYETPWGPAASGMGPQPDSQALVKLAALAYLWISDDIYVEDPYLSRILARIGRAPRFNRWMADTITPYVGQRVLEIGAGIGNLTQTLIPRQQYWATDINPLYVSRLQALAFDHPHLQAKLSDVAVLESFPEPRDFDTVVCLNVIEHIADDVLAMQNIREHLAPDGRAIILVPQGMWNFGSLDVVVGHYRRYTRQTLTALIEAAGFEVETLFGFNRIGTVAWFLNGRLTRRKTFGLLQIWMLNWLTPIFRVLEPYLPWPTLSLIIIARKPVGS
jgi:SAM-dependent methyltransferase